MGRFSFRQFEICDDDATMKVGTDAVLLGAWAQVSGCQRILDIGTGSAVIALMMAQRTPPGTTIDAIDINVKDAGQAQRNVAASPWAARIHVIHTAVQEFHPSSSYDLIISNPPYFSSSLLPPGAERASARHDLQLSAVELLTASRRLMTDEGSLALILPSAESESFFSLALSNKLYLSRLTRFYTRKGKPQERSLMQFHAHEGPVMENTLTLYESDSAWSFEYTHLTQDFYLPRS
ncbi:MAG: methyltransferase [Bacteroidetes bacterium]|nr:methyltransferase [Bacteroidota bacterium]